jgi:glycosyltransferase involved in cell wall biosynthesis
MNILVVSAMFPPIRTGTSYYARNLAEALTTRGHRVHIVTLENQDAGKDAFPFPVDRIPALHFPMKNYFKHFRIASAWPSNYRRLKEIAVAHKTEIILLVNHYLDIAFPAIYASQMLGIPLVCSVGTQLQSLRPFRHAILKMGDRLICGQFVFPFCKKIVAWDAQIMAYLRDVQGARLITKTRIVNFGPNGDCQALLAQEHDDEFHSQLIGVGSVTEQRSFVPLIRAFKKLAESFPTLRLKIIGHVYYDAAVREVAALGLSNRVEFTGEQPHDDVLEEMKRSDAFFVSLTGRYVGLGTATLEAMMLGVPVVANVPLDLLGLVTLKDMEHIVHCDGVVPETIAARLQQLLTDKDLRRTVGQGGRDFVKQNLNWEKVAEDMEHLLCEACDEAKC